MILVAGGGLFFELNIEPLLTSQPGFGENIKLTRPLSHELCKMLLSVFSPILSHTLTVVNVWERIGEKHLAQLMGEGACQPDISTKYRLGC